MTALVWSVESAILGAWALVFSFYSTPFHAFIARSHCMIAGFTLILQLVSTARDLPIGHAVAEAFVCAVTALLLVYVTALLDRDNNSRFFSMSSAGLFPMDAVIGIAWFCAAFVSAMGMALSGVGTVDNVKRKASLMFHQYGYHTSIVLPSFLMLWLYNYDASNTNEPVTKGIKFASNNSITATHTILFIVYACIWGWFVLTQFLGEGMLTRGKQWPAWKEMSGGEYVGYITSVAVKFLGRCGCVLIPLSAVFVSKTYAQMILGWILVGVSGAYALDLLGMIDRLVGKKKTSDTAKEQDEDYEPSAPMMMETNAEYNDPRRSETKLSFLPIIVPTSSTKHNHSLDPAAVAMLTDCCMISNSTKQQHTQWRREKMV